jgi:two-component system OmpR family sensor kinase
MRAKGRNIFCTIRGKLTILYVLIFGAILTVSGIALYAIFSHQLKSDFDRSIESSAFSLGESIEEDGMSPAEILNDLSETFSSSGYGDLTLLEIFREDGTMAMASPQLAGNALPIKTADVARAFAGKLHFGNTEFHLKSISNKAVKARLFYYPVKSRSVRYLLTFAVPTAKLDHILLRLRLVIIILVPFAMVISAAAGWFLSGKAFAPVNRVIAAAKTIEVENLSRRLPVRAVDDEISELSITLNEMIERLEKSFRVQRQFTADASHELRTPLTILAGQIEVALQKARQASEYQETLRANLEEIQRLQKIVDSLLLLSRLDSGKLNIGDTAVRLDEILLASIEKLGDLAKSRGIIFDLQLADSPDRFRVQGDPASLQNVLLNLVDNALKYSNQGGILHCALRVVDQFAELEIRDCGDGIAPEHLGRVFERFYRADHSTAKEGRSGAGLGLAIAKAVVEAHGGTIAIDSNPGEGTVVKIKLLMLVGMS